MSLPEEIWGLIFKNMSQNEALNLRLVCHDWKAEIDHHYSGLEIQLDENNERSPGIENLLKLRIKKCNIIKFLKPSPLGLGTIFKHPNLITSLDISITPDRNLCFESVSRQNLHYILKSCSKNLKVLSLSMTPYLLHQPYYTDDLLGYEFESLVELQICIIQRDPEQEEPLTIMEDNVLHRIVSSSTIPNILSLSVDMSCTELCEDSTNRVSFEVLSFATKYGKTLEELNIRLFFNEEDEYDLHRTGWTAPTDLDTIDVSILKDIVSLETLSICLNIKEAGFLMNAWIALLQNQSKLEFLEVFNLPISSTFFKDIVYNNYERLKTIEIWDLTILDRCMVNDTEMRVLDLSLLQNCLNLEYLSLRYDQMTSEHREHVPIIRNLYTLPEKIELLDISEFLIHSDDIYKFICKHRLLSSFSMSNCGVSQSGPHYGVSGTVIEELLCEENASVKDVTIEYINSSVPEELVKLNAIFALFNCPPLDNYDDVRFELNKESVSGTWKLDSYSIDDEEDDDDSNRS